MPAYEVTIVRTITTVVEVFAETAADARQEIEDYGIAEAAKDYEPTDEEVSARIKAVKRWKRKAA